MAPSGAGGSSARTGGLLSAGSRAQKALRKTQRMRLVGYESSAHRSASTPALSLMSAAQLLSDGATLGKMTQSIVESAVGSMHLDRKVASAATAAATAAAATMASTLLNLLSPASAQNHPGAHC